MPSRSSHTVLRPRASRQQVRNALRDLILAGRWAPGCQLNQHELAGELGASLGMVREVLLELRGAGLIEMRDNLGFFVSELNPKRLMEIYGLRVLHEGYAARLCCDCAGPRDIRELRDLAERSHAHRCSGEPEQVKEGLLLDRQMHNRVIEMTGNQTLIQVTRSYWAPLIVCDESQLERAEETYRDHLAVIEAIEKNRPEDAEQLMRRHVGLALQYAQQQAAEGRLVLKWWV